MHANDLIIFATNLEEQFPGVPDDVVERCWNQAHKAPLATAKAAIKRHRDERGSSKAPPDPQRIAYFCQTIGKPGLLDHAKNQIGEGRRVREMVLSEHAADDAIVEAMDPGEYEELVREIKQMQPNYGWLSSDGRTMKGLVAKRARELRKLVNASGVE